MKVPYIVVPYKTAYSHVVTSHVVIGHVVMWSSCLAFPQNRHLNGNLAHIRRRTLVFVSCVAVV